jgi:predicted GNAT family N-acyltransferase
MALTIAPFDKKKHIRDTFSCGEESLDNYIRRGVSQDIKRRIAAVYVLTDQPNDEVLGYYTLSSYTIEIMALEESFSSKFPRYPLLPATLLGRLAVDENQKGKGFGQLLLLDSMKRSLEVSKDIASIALVVDALNEKALSFYLKYGFKQFKDEPMKLYYPIEYIEKIEFQ